MKVCPHGNGRFIPKKHQIQHATLCPEENNRSHDDRRNDCKLSPLGSRETPHHPLRDGLHAFFRFKLQLRIMEYHMAHLILHRQRKYLFIAFHEPYILFGTDV